jgi:hypothetical protein
MNPLSICRAVPTFCPVKFPLFYRMLSQGENIALQIKGTSFYEETNFSIIG